MTKIIEAIIELSGGTAEVGVEGDDINKITWMNGATPIPKADIQAKANELQTEYETQEYARNRRRDYPDVEEQLNKIYDDGLTKWKAEMVDPVKAKWPKDNSGPV